MVVVVTFAKMTFDAGSGCGGGLGSGGGGWWW